MPTGLSVTMEEWDPALDLKPVAIGQEQSFGLFTVTVVF